MTVTVTTGRLNKKINGKLISNLITCAARDRLDQKTSSGSNNKYNSRYLGGNSCQWRLAHTRNILMKIKSVRLTRRFTPSREHKICIILRRNQTINSTLANVIILVFLISAPII